MYWNVSVDLKCVRTSTIDSFWDLSPLYIVTWATILGTCNVLMTRTLQDKLQNTRYNLQSYFAILREIEGRSTFLQLKLQFFFVKHSSEAQFCPKLSRDGVSLQVVRENIVLCDSASNVPE